MIVKKVSATLLNFKFLERHFHVTPLNACIWKYECFFCKFSSEHLHCDPYLFIQTFACLLIMAVKFTELNAQKYFVKSVILETFAEVVFTFKICFGNAHPRRI